MYSFQPSRENRTEQNRSPAIFPYVCVCVYIYIYINNSYIPHVTHTQFGPLDLMGQSSELG